jgi:hypothetical protein
MCEKPKRGLDRKSSPAEVVIFDTGELKVWKNYITGNVAAGNIITWEPMPGERYVYYITRVEAGKVYGYRK